MACVWATKKPMKAVWSLTAERVRNRANPVGELCRRRSAHKFAYRRSAFAVDRRYARRQIPFDTHERRSRPLGRRR